MADFKNGADEKWDDSELIADWNQAYNEYKKYHSLAVRGEKVDEADALQLQAQVNETPSDTADEPVVDIDVNSPTDNAMPNAGITAASHIRPQALRPEQAQDVQDRLKQPGLPQIAPELLSGSSSHQDLKNAMMAWYYAGYYTGLYDGQQKAYAEMQDRG